jgi:hypothetical protein
MDRDKGGQSFGLPRGREECGDAAVEVMLTEIGFISQNLGSYGPKTYHHVPWQYRSAMVVTMNGDGVIDGGHSLLV